MIITTSGQVEGRKIAKTIGLVKGSTIRARHVGRDIMAGLRGIVGGEVTDSRSEGKQLPNCWRDGHGNRKQLSGCLER